MSTLKKTQQETEAELKQVGVEEKEELKALMEAERVSLNDASDT
jgi:hypothetical protein